MSSGRVATKGMGCGTDGKDQVSVTLDCVLAAVVVSGREQCCPLSLCSLPPSADSAESDLPAQQGQQQAQSSRIKQNT